jgi:hypothetical protein
MMDSFDSRALRLTDCYGQRFMRPGVFHYNILPAFSGLMSDQRPFVIEVVEAREKKEMAQHSVVIRADKGRFRPERNKLVIEATDLVLWYCPEQKAMPYAVVGDKEFFASSRLVNECGYSHAFGVAGEYAWVDAYGSGAGGVVRVKDPGCKSEADIQRWREMLAEGALVTVTGDRAEPQEVEIVTGQTVYFAITKGPGISITDKRLVPEKGAQTSY